MKKKVSRAFAACLIIISAVLLFTVNADAASASLWFTDPGVTVGNNVSVVVDVKGDNIGGYQMNVSYDPSYLRFVSSKGSTNYFSAVDNGGVIAVYDMLDQGSATKMSFTLTFNTLKTGTTKLTPSEYRFFDGSGDPIDYGAIGDSTISINAVPEASSDATLKSLTINSGTLTPDFSPSVTDYAVSVDYSVTSLVVSALKNHNGATVYVSGNDELAVGENRVTVSVTAENGAVNYYTINVTRGKNPLSTGLTASMGDGLTSEISNTIGNGLIPKGFELTKMTIAGVEIDALKYDEKGQPVVYLLGGEGVPEGLYYIDPENMKVTPVEKIGSSGSDLLILDVKIAKAPDGYKLGTYTIAGTEMEAIVPENTNEPNHCLVYAIGASGEKTLYLYDPVENTFQRYGFAVTGEPLVTEPEESTTSPAETVKQPETSGPDETTSPARQNGTGGVFKWIFIIIAVLIVILVIVAIFLRTKYY